ncbi:uncharacterized protein LOC129001650 [Macrosteles quadrilineatus]|uniref:uncharacterized protein LOC129001650 n=1 Tax=Macrosteles quadrilineatus TaxID=74068 RepID=UPI0023E276F4|nr:uncharacterized protein LOC129001650 [Macrosteles quadrilineatus]XP_054284996.1 uncharacterized protein LOC129001650 [Macrosteles quadrilineatus]XP_054284997.1 uncharacterized protein LOC129001650 [Macrosteles quadrilineatus]
MNQGNSLKRKSITNNSKMVSARKRKSLLLQHSLSLHIPMEDISQCSEINCFVNLPDQVFSLTYLTENDTLNPESLNMLEDFRYGTWHVYLVGLLYNFSYQPAQRTAIEKAINSGLRKNSQNSKVQMTYHTQVSQCQGLSPTDNDSEALKITIIGVTSNKQRLLYEGYLVSWCSTIKESRPFLPVLLCKGNVAFRQQVNSILSQKFDVIISRLSLTEEELKHLSTYCLIMLDRNEDAVVTYSYKLQTGDNIKLSMPVEALFRLWKKIHPDDSVEIMFDEVDLFHEALDKFYESTFGIKIGMASFQTISVQKYFSLYRNSKMCFKTTKVIHVVFKYLNHLAIKRLRLQTLNNVFDEGYMGADTSVMSH